MATVRRGNVILNISDGDISKYMAKGFSVFDPVTGKVIKECVPTDLSQLQKAYTEHEETIKKLEAEIADLKAKLAEKPNSDKATVEPKEEEGWDDWGEEEPKKSGRQKKSK